MEKIINGKAYELHTEVYGCKGCAFENDGNGCDEAGFQCFPYKIWKLKQEDKK